MMLCRTATQEVMPYEVMDMERQHSSAAFLFAVALVGQMFRNASWVA